MRLSMHLPNARGDMPGAGKIEKKKIRREEERARKLQSVDANGGHCVGRPAAREPKQQCAAPADLRWAAERFAARSGTRCKEGRCLPQEALAACLVGRSRAESNKGKRRAGGIAPATKD